MSKHYPRYRAEEEAAYTLFLEDSFIKAKNGRKGIIEFKGTDATPILQSIVTANLGRLAIKRGIYPCSGKITIPSTIDGLFWDCEPGAVLRKINAFVDDALLQRDVVAGHAYSLVPVEAGYYDYFVNLNIDGNRANVVPNSRGMAVLGDAGNVAAAITLLNCNLFGHTSYGLEVDRTNLITMIGGNVKHNRLHGIRNRRSAANIFETVNIEANGYSAGPGYTGLSMEDNSYDNKILNCDFGLNNGDVGAGDTGLQVIEDTTCASNTYIGCKIQSNIVPLKPYSILGKGSQLIGCVGTNGQLLNWFVSHIDKRFIVPTNAAWVVTDIVGSGVMGQEPFRLWCNAGGTANSKALAQISTFGLNSGTISRTLVDWTKRLEMEFWVARVTAEAEAVCRFQLKEIHTEGILAERGIGIQITNLAMVGESYGSARGTVALGSLTSDRIKRIKIVVNGTQVEFWVDGVLTGTLTGTAVPAVVGTATGSMVASAINGATGGVSAYLMLGDIKIKQEW